MARRRKYRSKSNPNYSKTKRYLGYAGSVAQTANTALKVATAAYKLKNLMNVEYKYYDTVVSNPTVGNGGSYVSNTFNEIDQGDTGTTRDGNSIKMTKVSFHGTLQHNGTNCKVRLVVIDMKAYHSGYAYSNAFEGTIDPNSFYDLQEIGNFRILKDFTIMLNDQTGAVRDVQFHIPLNIHAKYDGPGGGDITRHRLSLLAISNATTNLPTLEGIIRLRYLDN